MAFLGHSELVSVLEQLINVSGGPQITRTAPRPVMVLEGAGGSGRSTLLRRSWQDWSARTATAWVDPVAVARAGGSVRDLLVLVMLGLSDPRPGYELSFPRVVLAHGVMDRPIGGTDPETARQEAEHRINQYRQPDALLALVARLIDTVAPLFQVPGAESLPPEMVTPVAQEMTRRIERWLRKKARRDLLDWFGHQDQGLPHNPNQTIVQLSIQAQSDEPAVRADVDQLLVAALLADLRDSMARIAGRPWNALVLLDNADAPPAVDFVRTLVQVRTRMDPSVEPDPLAVVATSGGPLVAQLAGIDNRPPRFTESQLADVTARKPWFSVLVGELTADHVGRLARDRTWPDRLGSGLVAQAVYALTRGHAAATGLVLDILRAHPQLIDDLDSVLREPSPDPGRTVEQYLLDQAVAGLSPRRHVNRDWLQTLTTLAAARDQAEAALICTMDSPVDGRPLLQTPISATPVLLTSTTLWSTPGPRGHPTLAPLTRYLLLRGLAARPQGRPPSWCVVFTGLRDRTADSDEIAGRLHHELALGQVDAVARALDDRLPGTPGDQWLSLLDQVVATPRLVAGGPAWPADPQRPDAGPTQRQHDIAHLVDALHQLADPRHGARATLLGLYQVAAHCLGQLAHAPPDGPLPFLNRAQHYRKLADGLA